MSDDAMLRLTISMDTNPGVYALLLGSGISRSANIPTGWDIVLDLTRKVASSEGNVADPDPEAWYRQRFGEAPDYSKLLDRLTKTPAERMTLLRPYFEPDEEERERGEKLPTPAHHAIAGLVKAGYVRVIITTNFDRLLEMALQDVGITPDVIFSEDGIQGAMPYVHSHCTIVKLHGDYRDTRLRNTVGELESYGEGFNDLLDRIFDDYGLIICGWSGEWDTALRQAIRRIPNRRFATFWLSRGQVRGRAQELVVQRRAETIMIQSADDFLPRLLEQLESLRELRRPAPLSTAMVVATVKRYITDPTQRIRLFDFFDDELVALITAGRLKLPQVHQADESVWQRWVRGCEAAMERLLAMLAALAFHDEGPNAPIITRCIERLMGAPPLKSLNPLDYLRLYPALLASYIAGMSALAGGRYVDLAAVLWKPTFRPPRESARWPIIARLYPGNVFTLDLAVPRSEDGGIRKLSDYLHDALRGVLRPYLPDDVRYTEVFDTFELLLSLTYRDLVGCERHKDTWAPVGAFGQRYSRLEAGKFVPWRFDDGSEGETPLHAFMKEGVELREQWPLLQAGFFRGSYDRFVATLKDHDEWVAEILAQG